MKLKYGFFKKNSAGKSMIQRSLIHAYLCLIFKSGKQFQNDLKWKVFRVIQEPSSRYPKVRHEKFAKACGDECSFQM